MIVYRGPSLLDGAPIVVVVTGTKSKSANDKTADLLQTYILCDDVDPLTSAEYGDDARICGDCPHAGPRDGTLRGRVCYVELGKAPMVVWDALQRGVYPTVAPADLPALGAGRKVRLGAYGDPAAVPRWVWEGLTSRAKGWTGYTHQWRQGFALADLCMASCDSEADLRDAEALGYRGFLVTAGPVPRLPGRMVCPASVRDDMTCERCMVCNGFEPGRPGPQAHVTIPAHGPAARLVALRTPQKNVTGAEPLAV